MSPSLRNHVYFVIAFGLSPLLCGPAEAAILGSGFFSGTVVRFDEQTQAQTTFATIASATDPFPGLAGIAYNRLNNRVIVSARISNRLYEVDGSTGDVISFFQLDSSAAPGGVAVDASGNVYVANVGSSSDGNTVSVFDSNWNPINTITLPNIGLGNNLPSGLGFDNEGRLLISTFSGAGVFRYDPTTMIVSPYANEAATGLANGQVAVDAAGNAYVGGAAFSNSVVKIGPSGTPIDPAFINVTAAVLPEPELPFTSPNFSSPSGVVIDGDGNLIVAALGRTNPFSMDDSFQNNGGLFKFSAVDGSLISTFGTNLTPLSGVAIIPNAVPEPGSMALLLGGGMLSSWVMKRSRAAIKVATAS